MKTVRFTCRGAWLAAVIGVLGIIGGARQKVWASNVQVPLPIESPKTGSLVSIEASAPR